MLFIVPIINKSTTFAFVVLASVVERLDNSFQWVNTVSLLRITNFNNDYYKKQNHLSYPVNRVVFKSLLKVMVQSRLL